MFIKEAPGADYAVRSVLYSMVNTAAQVRDREWQQGAAQLDPLVSAGWKAMVTLSIGIIVFTAGLGYVVYLLAFARANRNQMGFLQAMGLTRRQVTGLLSVEHLLVAVFGLGLGTWAGYEMSRIMVSALAVTGSGQPVVPPVHPDDELGGHGAALRRPVRAVRGCAAGCEPGHRTGRSVRDFAAGDGVDAA